MNFMIIKWIFHYIAFVLHRPNSLQHNINGSRENNLRVHPMTCIQNVSFINSCLQMLIYVIFYKINLRKDHSPENIKLIHHSDFFSVAVVKRSDVAQLWIRTL